MALKTEQQADNFRKGRFNIMFDDTGLFLAKPAGELAVVRQYFRPTPTLFQPFSGSNPARPKNPNAFFSAARRSVAAIDDRCDCFFFLRAQVPRG